MKIPYRVEQLVKLLGPFNPGSYYHHYVYNYIASNFWINGPETMDMLNDLIGFFYPNLGKTYKDGAITLYVNGFNEYLLFNISRSGFVELAESEFIWTMTEEKWICKIIQIALKADPDYLINPAFEYATQSSFMTEDELMRFAGKDEIYTAVDKTSDIHTRKFKSMNRTFISEEEKEEIVIKIKPECLGAVKQRAQRFHYKMFIASCQQSQ